MLVATTDRNLTQTLKHTVTQAILTKGKAQTQATWNRLGEFGGIVAVLNIIAVKNAYNDIHGKAYVSAEEKRLVKQSLGYAAAAIAGVFQGSAWVQIKGKEDVLSKPVRLWFKAGAEELAEFSDDLIKQARQFSRFTLISAGFGLFAAVIEGCGLYEEFKRTEGIEQGLIGIKIGSVGTMGLINVAQCYRFLTCKLIGSLFAGWMVTGLWIAGAIYLVVTLIQSNLRKDEYQKWLMATKWETSPGSDWSSDDSQKIIQKTLGDLYRIMLKPTLYVKSPITDYKSSGVTYPPSVGISEKLHFKLYVPAALKDSDITVEIYSDYIVRESKRCRWIKNEDDNVYILELTFSKHELLQTPKVAVRYGYSNENYNFYPSLTSDGAYLEPVAESVDVRRVYRNKIVKKLVIGGA
ncbi:hypothetical protein [Photobacterium sp.]|uniref:hypothetical protein n=1 Tax=Photobacterium sp. TaxID=660 RepID=UPI00299E36DF|nr:hypothetical protein [Photobacterium sp.]MDX1302284.1 hypothetical protein [Photobacterium sp.]